MGDEVYTETGKIAVDIHIGNDEEGNRIICDVLKFPHLLIGGTTGSGKTTFIHSLITEMIRTEKSNLLKFIIFDSKGIDYNVFCDLPHLLIPIITDFQKARGVMEWLLMEIKRRMELFADNTCKDIESFNKNKEALAYIFVVFDDFSELSISHGANVIESGLMPVLSFGRSVGIHAIIATSVPTSKIITKSLRALIPSRISFSVPAKEYSKLLLDKDGAERLIQQGEFILKTFGVYRKGLCNYISSDEIKQMVLANQNKCKISSLGMDKMYIENPQIAKIIEPPVCDDYDDEFFDEAVEFLLKKGKASSSVLQRQFRIGYSRASRLIEVLEARGVIGPEDGSKPRSVIMSRQEWLSTKASTFGKK